MSKKKTIFFFDVDFLSEMLVGAKKMGSFKQRKRKCLVRLRVGNEWNWSVGPQWDLPTRIHLIVTGMIRLEFKIFTRKRKKETKCFESKAAWPKTKIPNWYKSFLIMSLKKNKCPKYNRTLNIDWQLIDTTMKAVYFLKNDIYIITFLTILFHIFLSLQ